MDGPRIRVMDGGMGTSDLSTISPDHQVSAEPITARQIEVLRGPATLLYGSGASGGVVNVVTNRIPESRQEGFYGSAEYQFARRERHARRGRLPAGRRQSNFAWHLDGYKRKTGDYSIPGAQNPNDPASPRGRLPNSFTDSDGFSAGGSLVGDRGYVGLSYQQLNSVYGIPTPDASHIDMRQHRTDVAGELTDPLPGFTRLRVKLRDSKYQHAEIESTGDIGTVFRTTATRAGSSSRMRRSAAGPACLAQTENKTISALGEEAIIPKPGIALNGCSLVEDYSVARLLFNSAARGGKGNRATRTTNPSRSFSLASYSAGTVWNFTRGYALALSLTSAQRAPTTEELYSNSAHVATNTFEIGDPTLNKESSRNIDLQFRKTAGAWRGRVRRVPEPDQEPRLCQERRPGRRRRRRPHRRHHPETRRATSCLSITRKRRRAFAALRSDLATVRTPPSALARASSAIGPKAALRGGGNLPRISPARLGFEADYKQGAWTTYGMLLRVFRQDRVGVLETETPGYTRLDAGVEYLVKASDKVTTTLFLRGNNLLDQEMRVHTSFIKDFAPCPGARSSPDCARTSSSRLLRDDRVGQAVEHARGIVLQHRQLAREHDRRHAVG